MTPTRLAERPAFQNFLGAATMRLHAARALALEANEAAWTTVNAGERLSPQRQAELRAASVHVTDVCLELVTGAFRFAGGSALYDTSVLQRCWRDLAAGGQHFMVSDSGYEALGQFLLGVAGAEPMR